jgi:hypothetical protein
LISLPRDCPTAEDKEALRSLSPDAEDETAECTDTVDGGAQPTSPKQNRKKKKKKSKKQGKQESPEDDDDMAFLAEQVKLVAKEKAAREKAVLSSQKQKEEAAANSYSATMASALKAMQAVDGASKEKAMYTHADGTVELVDVVKRYSEADGSGVSVFIPSLGRERQVR